MTDPLERRLQELRDLADEFAEAESKRVYLEAFKHSKLAILMKEFEGRYSTVAAQEREARAHPEYLELLEGLREATHIAERARWHLRIAERGSSLYQTQEATKRAELQAYNTRPA